MIFEDAVTNLKEIGLNIFLSAKVSSLPDDIFPFTDTQKEKTLCLIGHGGTSLWNHLPLPKDLQKNPIDQFSIKAMTTFAHDVLEDDIEILFPNDEYLIPLQKLSRHLNLSHQSPLGLDINSEYGLWFAFRGVFLTSTGIPLISKDKTNSPCEICVEQFCTLESEISLGRLNCPVKSEHQYSSEQQLYHQSALKMLL